MKITYSYEAVGNRDYMELDLDSSAGYEIRTDYTYDNLNRLLSVTHEKPGPQQLAQYDYTLKADGMRTQLAEDISTGGGRDIIYTYDNLNRVLTESASAANGSYYAEYTYDIVGNRTKRLISANGQCMQTDYEYNDKDQLVKETHTDPGVCFYLDGKPVYAYMKNGQVTHYRLYGSSENIGPLKAFMLGIPTKWSNYVMTTIFGLLAVILLLPLFISHRGQKVHRFKYLLRQLLILLLAYLMLIDPAYLQQVAQASIDYGSLSRSNWGIVDTDVHYRYDDNGSQAEKIVADKDEPDPDNNFNEKTLYTYNLRNQLTMVEYTTDGVNWDVTTYKYNDEGIRVEKNDNGTVTEYLVDSYNHTGYAQVLEEWTDDVLTKTYIIGDDIIGEANNSGTFKFYLYDGQNSVRHHSDNSGNLKVYNYTGGSCDTFSYDAYGHRVDPLQDVVSDTLLYTGEMYDSSAEMYYLRARYYNPLNGRFNQEDRFAGSQQDPQSLHKYLYCHANPVNFIDPSGMFSLTGLNISMTIRTALYSMVSGIKFAASYQFATSTIAKAVLWGIFLTTIALAAYSRFLAPTVVVFIDKNMKPTTLHNPSKSEIKEKMREYKENNVTLSAFYVRSHAAKDFMYLSGNVVLSVSGGTFNISDAQGPYDIGADLQDLLKRTGTIILAGCHTGEGDDSLAEDVSRILPNRRVLGGKRYTAQLPLTDSSFFVANIFKNGKKIGEDFGFHGP